MPSGAHAFVLIDGDGRTVVTAEVMPPHGQSKAYIAWTPNPGVEELVEQTAGQLCEGLDDLRENMCQLDSMHFSR
jgi:hypothetical protein